MLSSVEGILCLPHSLEEPESVFSDTTFATLSKGTCADVTAGGGGGYCRGCMQAIGGRQTQGYRGKC